MVVKSCVGLLLAVLLHASAAFADLQTSFSPVKEYLAITVNADNGVEAAIAKSDYIAHIWESAPGQPSANPWTQYKPGGSDVVMQRDPAGRIMIAWLHDGQLMLMTEPGPRSGLDGPAVMVGGLHLTALRAARRPSDGSIILVALTDKGDVITRRQQLAALWEFTAEDDLGSHDLKSIAVAATGDGRFTIVATGGDKTVYAIGESAPHAAWTPWTTLNGHDIRATEVASDANGLLQVLALGGDKRVYFTRENLARGFPDWGLVSATTAGDTITVGPKATDRSLIVWGGNGHAFAEATPNGVWTDCCGGQPGARILTTTGDLIDVNPHIKTVTNVVTTYHPASTDPNCSAAGTTFTDGSPCSPTIPAYTSTSATQVSQGFEIAISRNGNSSILTTAKP